MLSKVQKAFLNLPSKFVKISPNLIEAFICFNLSNIYFNMSPRKEFIVLLMAFLALLNVLSEKCYSSKSFCVERIYVLSDFGGFATDRGQ